MRIDILNVKYQPDCIFYYTSDKVDSSLEVFPFTPVTQLYDKTVCVISSSDKNELGRTIKILNSFPNVRKIEVLSKGDNYAELCVYTNKTEVYKIVTRYGGVIIGTMSVVSGEEKWVVAFDNANSRKTVLDLFRDNNDVELSNSIELPPEFFSWLTDSFESLVDFFNTLKSLKQSQVGLFKEIVEKGYYEWPRKANITCIAEGKNCTRAAVSKRIRNVERTILKNIAKFL